VTRSVSSCAVRAKTWTPKPPARRCATPWIDGELIERILAAPRLRGAYDVRRDVALHPRTPELAALALISVCSGRTSVRVGLDTRLRPLVRRAADQRLGDRLSEIAVGEKW
jgi:hypothetical protein